MTTTPSGCSARQAASCSASIEAASEQPGVEVGDQHGLLGAQDRGRLGHEVHAAEAITSAVAGGGLAGEPERVADVVGDVLDLGHLVVVREDHRVALGGERAHLCGQRRDLRGR